MATTIKVRQNGSYLVEGDDVKLVDWNGNEYTPANPQKFALCRCGHSTRKPFCDGTHSKIGFEAAEAAIGPEAADRPAEAVPPANVPKPPTEGQGGGSA